MFDTYNLYQIGHFVKAKIKSPILTKHLKMINI